MTPFMYKKFTNKKYKATSSLAPNVSTKLNVMFVINTFSKIVNFKAPKNSYKIGPKCPCKSMFQGFDFHRFSILLSSPTFHFYSIVIAYLFYCHHSPSPSLFYYHLFSPSDQDYENA
jgi:hypothetical protein